MSLLKRNAWLLHDLFSPFSLKFNEKALWEKFERLIMTFKVLLTHKVAQ